jgi:hypothetical protein
MELAVPTPHFRRLLRLAAAAFVLLSVSPGVAQRGAEGPLADLAGSWSGTGAITMANGARERIRCKADYGLANRTTVQVQMTCASDSYKFELRSNISALDQRLAGTWNELTRGVGGQIVGRIVDNRLEIRAEGQTFTALLDMTTRGNRQSVSIRSPGSEMSEVSISLTRQSR